MPRTRTGRPSGRPAGRGCLGEEGAGHKRLTVRLPVALYDALAAEAQAACEQGRRPDLARTVRTALEHFLACPDKRQTQTLLPPSGENNEQIIHKLLLAEENTRQTRNVPEALEDNTGQTINVPEVLEALEDLENNNRQTESLPVIAPASRAVLIARLRQMRASGLSFQQIADQLYAEGVPTPSGGERWLKAMVHRLTAPSTA
jgi:hypothetical protein